MLKYSQLNEALANKLNEATKKEDKELLNKLVSEYQDNPSPELWKKVEKVLNKIHGTDLAKGAEEETDD